ncbi:MAG TPA: protocatechuate 3,4-dioxygenase subunit beta [Ilumatobacteraceae bacterium]|nr:protocatechuate 3,4-dioxygenase subunit beta [Ilumatobacteraceae bacterium]
MLTYTPRVHEDHPPFLYSDYKSTVKRSPQFEPLAIVQTLTETTGPGPAWAELSDDDADLTTNAGTGGEAIGQRSIITGHVYDQNGNPLPNTLIEIWQANACGRYMHWRETAFPAPLDSNFLGVGQCRTTDEGEYRFLTIKPGPYPWGNHPNAWRPAHIHFSLLGPSIATRLVTQMYFPDDPLFDLDPIFCSVPKHARQRLIATYDHSVTVENWALGYRWDIVLRGTDGSP